MTRIALLPSFLAAVKNGPQGAPPAAPCPDPENRMDPEYGPCDADAAVDVAPPPHAVRPASSAPAWRRNVRIDIHITKHFRDNWAARVGGPDPAPDMIHQILNESVAIQRGRQLADRTGTIVNTLSIYWHPGLDLIIKIDNFTGAAVTVLSAQNGKSKPKNRRPTR